MKQLKILKFPFENEISLTIIVQIVPENSLKTLPAWFLFRTGEAFHREETNQVEVLEGESVFSQKLFFYFFHQKKTDR